jgi:HSP20 family protein
MFLLNFAIEVADVSHAAITVKAAQCTSSGCTKSAVRTSFQAKESDMFFAPVLRTRAASPSFRSFDRSFERFVNDTFYSSGGSAGFNVEQDDKAWTITLDMPGIAREDLSIDIEGSIVRIETKAEAKRQYKAAYELPQDIDAEASGAKLENGVLALTLVKKVPVSNARQIDVK